MRLIDHDARDRLMTASFGVLGTVDHDRGVHLVPVVFHCDETHVCVPVDTIKEKATTLLRRITNLEADERASLLVDQRTDDWSDLWWVRADLLYLGRSNDASCRAALERRYPPYRSGGAIDSLLRFAIERLTGWHANTPPV